MHKNTTENAGGNAGGIEQFLGVFRYSRRAIELVWSTHRGLTIVFGLLTLIAGILPAGMAYLGQLIVDGVIAAMQERSENGVVNTQNVFFWVGMELLLVITIAAAQRGISSCQSLLRALLGQRVNVMILEKALTLQLSHFEDSEFYDKLTRARRQASSRPLSLVKQTFSLVQNILSLISYSILLIQFSPWAMIILIGAGFPAFFAETKFSSDTFQLFRWRSPDMRMQMYIETVLAREDGVKEVKLYQLGALLLQRYRNIFNRFYAEDRNLTLRRDSWGYAMGIIGSLAFYGAYVWVAYETILGSITLGEMTMHLLLFRQGQSAVSSILSGIGGMYEDNLYLSNLYEYLEHEVPEQSGKETKGTQPNDGIRFEEVSFVYPGSTTPALNKVSLHLRPGESLALVGENGSGKTTLIKLLTRLYQPSSGRILLDGLDLEKWEIQTLRHRVGVIFQDFARYQFLVGENVGAGDVNHFEDEDRWKEAAEKGMAASFIQEMPQGYQTQLGRWFKGGRELSGGQWQKIALSRAFMRTQADILVLDEPTAAMDAQAEATIFEHFQKLTKERIAILISHRFSTVRMANHIVVIQDGSIKEEGTHESLMKLDGRYAHLFSLQAAGYQ